jgi:hypothetical protein
VSLSRSRHLWSSLARMAVVIAIIYVVIHVVPRRDLSVFWTILIDGVAIFLGIIAITMPLPMRAEREGR